ncbi:hypothetical protein Sjap_022267 [Stephania japonica]|uniref:Uncharacterized protein n=1 Tax=Stephania japonica TaxID=461633 RepID=A0AAP0ER74_9MAGN
MGSCCGRGNIPTVTSQGNQETDFIKPMPFLPRPYEEPEKVSASQPKTSKGESKTKYDEEDEEDGKSTDIGKPKRGHEENMSIGVGAGAASSKPSVSKDEPQQVPSASSVPST